MHAPFPVLAPHLSSPTIPHASQHAALPAVPPVAAVIANANYVTTAARASLVPPVRHLVCRSMPDIRTCFYRPDSPVPPPLELEPLSNTVTAGNEAPTAFPDTAPDPDYNLLPSPGLDQTQPIDIPSRSGQVLQRLLHPHQRLRADSDLTVSLHLASDSAAPASSHNLRQVVGDKFLKRWTHRQRGDSQNSEVTDFQRSARVDSDLLLWNQDESDLSQPNSSEFTHTGAIQPPSGVKLALTSPQVSEFGAHKQSNNTPPASQLPHARLVDRIRRSINSRSSGESGSATPPTSGNGEDRNSRRVANRLYKSDPAAEESGGTSCASQQEQLAASDRHTTSPVADATAMSEGDIVLETSTSSRPASGFVSRPSRTAVGRNSSRLAGTPGSLVDNNNMRQTTRSDGEPTVSELISSGDSAGMSSATDGLPRSNFATMSSRQSLRPVRYPAEPGQIAVRVPSKINRPATPVSHERRETLSKPETILSSLKEEPDSPNSSINSHALLPTFGHQPPPLTLDEAAALTIQGAGPRSPNQQPQVNIVSSLDRKSPLSPSSVPFPYPPTAGVSESNHSLGLGGQDADVTGILPHHPNNPLRQTGPSTSLVSMGAELSSSPPSLQASPSVRRKLRRISSSKQKEHRLSRKSAKESTKGAVIDSSPPGHETTRMTMAKLSAGHLTPPSEELTAKKLRRHSDTTTVLSSPFSQQASLLTKSTRSSALEAGSSGSTIFSPITLEANEASGQSLSLVRDHVFPLALAGLERN